MRLSKISSKLGVYHKARDVHRTLSGCWIHLKLCGCNMQVICDLSTHD